MLIQATRTIKASRDVLNDAHFGVGVYASPFPPCSISKEQHLLNNYGVGRTQGREHFADSVVILNVTRDKVAVIDYQGRRLIKIEGGDLHLVNVVIQKV